MGKYNKRRNSFFKNKKVNKCHSINVVIFLVMVVVITISVGYSALNASVDVDNVVAYMRTQADIRIVDLGLFSSTNGANSNYEKFSVSSVIGSITLPESDSTITYDIEVLNIGNVEMGIIDIVGLPSNLTYEFNNYTLGRVLCDDYDSTQCTLGSRTKVRLTIKYANGGYDSTNTTFSLNVGLTFEEIQYVARIGNDYYTTLQLAIDDVPTDDTATNIVLLKDTVERLSVVAHQNIIFDLSNLTISNDGNAPIIENNGAVTITNGLIHSAASQGAINVNAGGSLVVSGGSILATGIKQAIYNNGGLVTISGNAYIKSTSNQRAAVHNHLSGGSMVITGGTIISERFSAVLNEAGTLIVGVSGGGVNTSSPRIQGSIYGVNNSTGASVPVQTYFDYYDGLIIGKKAAIFDEAYVRNSESSYGIAHRFEYIESTLYDTARLAFIARVTFNPGDGTVDENYRNVEKGLEIGILPVPILNEYVFDGWFTAASGGVKAESNMVINDDITLFAHWTHESEVYVAKIGTTQYRTLASAVAAVKNNTATTISLIRDTVENITIASGKNITIDLQTYTLSSPNDSAVIVNNGICNFTSGTIMTNSKTTAAINNNASGTFVMSGGSIVARGLRQAIYNDGGKVTISGGYLEANTNLRATVQNHASSGSITITGGSIVSQNFSAINNEAGKLYIGTKDGNILNTPIIVGKVYGVLNAATFNFYDGIIRGITDSISGNIADVEANASVTYMVEIYDNVEYNKAFLS